MNTNVRRGLVFGCILITLLSAGVPVIAQGVTKDSHPNLTAAQLLIELAIEKLTAAQVANAHNLGGHAESAKRFLNQALKETTLALELLSSRASALFQLAGNGTSQQIDAAIKGGADLNAPSENGETPLMAALFNPNAGVVETLLKAGAKVNAQQNDGETALIYASMSGRPETIAMLLKAGASVNTQDENGVSALMWAAQYNQNPDAVTTLLKAGADARAKSKEGKAAIDYAANNSILVGTEAFRMLQQVSR